MISVTEKDLLISFDNVSELLKLIYSKVNTNRYKIVKVSLQLDKSFLASYWISKIDETLAGLGYPYKLKQSSYYLNTGMYYGTYFSYDTSSCSYKEISNSVIIDNEMELLSEIFPNLTVILRSTGEKDNLKCYRDSTRNLIKDLEYHGSIESYDREYSAAAEFGATINLKKVNQDSKRIPDSKILEFRECLSSNFYMSVDMLLNSYTYPSGIKSEVVSNHNSYDEFYDILDETVVPKYKLYKYDMTLSKYMDPKGKIKYKIIGLVPKFISEI